MSKSRKGNLTKIPFGEEMKKIARMTWWAGFHYVIRSLYCIVHHNSFYFKAFGSGNKRQLGPTLFPHWILVCFCFFWYIAILWTVILAESWTIRLQKGSVAVWVGSGKALVWKYILIVVCVSAFFEIDRTSSVFPIPPWMTHDSAVSLPPSFKWIAKWWISQRDTSHYLIFARIGYWGVFK